MSVEEARSVMWLRNNYRPLGELLDEGFLDRRRLEWAAARAYDPKLKQASAVLLDWMERTASSPVSASREPPAASLSQAELLPAVDAGMTVEQARTTVWPFRPFRGQPLGELIDTRQLTLRDLVYAVENAWDEQVRWAAVVLTAVRLNQVVDEPAPPAGPLKVLSRARGRSYAERRQSFLTLIQGIILGAALSFLIFLFVQSLQSHPSRHLAQTLASPTGAVAFVIVVGLAIGGGWLINRLVGLTVERLDREIESYRKGQDGEDRVVNAMRQNLDGNWALFRNVTLPGRSKADIDAVLVGPPGVWALEIKNLSGAYRNIGERWEFRTGGEWKRLKRSPSRQATDNAARLGHFFEADGIKQWVNPAVVWANREGALTVQNPAVAVWEIDRLPEELGNLWQHKHIEEAKRVRIIEKLAALSQQRTDEETE